jgi:hypothetical protein
MRSMRRQQPSIGDLNSALDDVLGSPHSSAAAVGSDAPALDDVAEGDSDGRQRAATIAGMARARAVYYPDRPALDAWFWLRNQHPVLGCFAAHPLHPFRRGARWQLLFVAVLFAVFTSVITLRHCAAQHVISYRNHTPIHTAFAGIDDPELLCPEGVKGGRQALSECAPYRMCYRLYIMQWACVSATMQLVMEYMAVCACIQPGGVLYGCCHWRCCGQCADDCIRRGRQGVLLFQLGACALLCVAIVLARQYSLNFVDIVLATLRTKAYSAGLAILLQLCKWLIWRRLQRDFWNGRTPPDRLPKSRIYLYPGLPTAEFLAATDHAYLNCARRRHPKKKPSSAGGRGHELSEGYAVEPARGMDSVQLQLSSLATVSNPAAAAGCVEGPRVGSPATGGGVSRKSDGSSKRGTRGSSNHELASIAASAAAAAAVEAEEQAMIAAAAAAEQVAKTVAQSPPPGNIKRRRRKSLETMDISSALDASAVATKAAAKAAEAQDQAIIAAASAAAVQAKETMSGKTSPVKIGKSPRTIK